MGKFEDAVEWVVAQAKDTIVDHDIDLPDLSAAEMILERYLPARYSEGANAGESHYEVSDLSAIELVHLAEKIPGAYDLAAKITATNIMAEVNLAPALRLFAFQVLTGRRTRPNPKPLSKRRKTWSRNFFKYSLAKYAEEQFDLKLTRNDSSPPQSACDAVEQGLAKVGHHTSFRAIKNICVHKSSQQLRLDYDLFLTTVPRIGLFSPSINPLDINSD